MFRRNPLFTVLFVMLLVAPAARADKPTVQNLRHTKGELARSAVTPRVSELLSPPSLVPASMAYDAGAMWVDQGVAAEQAAAEKAAAEQAAAEQAAAEAELRAAADISAQTGIEKPAQPEPAAPGAQASSLEQALASAAEKIRYPTSKARVRHRYHPHIDAIAELLRKHPDARVEVVGHTDVAGNDDYNQWLSTRRAERFRDHLVERGIDAKRIDVVGVGATQPLSDGETGDDQHRNRRVEVRLAK